MEVDTKTELNTVKQQAPDLEAKQEQVPRVEPSEEEEEAMSVDLKQSLVNYKGIGVMPTFADETLSPEGLPVWMAGLFFTKTVLHIMTDRHVGNPLPEIVKETNFMTFA